MNRRGAWATRWGFYFAAIGSAFGLGNLWRFPYIVGSSGGGAFILLYLLTVLLVGLPLLTAELLLGKHTRQSAISALEKLQPTALPWFGRMSLFISILLLSYYAVVSGWVLHFFIQFLVGLFVSDPLEHAAMFGQLMKNGWLQVGLTSLHLLFCGLVVAKGVQQGIEKWVGYLTPIFALLVVYLMTKSLSLSGASDALRFLFYPDFSKMTSTTLIRAVGHAFFTLSIGLGSMVVFGSYMRQDTPVPEAALRVTLVDSLISLCVGVLIFPIVFTGGFRVDSGPTLLFETIPVLLDRVGLGEFFGVAFFLCLYLSAVGASLGLLEANVSNLTDRRKFSRRNASVLMALVAFILGIFPALSSTVFERFQIKGMGLLQSLDSFMIHWLLPIVGLGISYAVSYKIKIKVLRNEFIWDQKESTYRLFRNWIFALRWLVPLFIGGALLSEIVGYFF